MCIRDRTVAEAFRKCPQLLTVETHFGEYKRFSRKVREIYERFTDCIEACSIDAVSYTHLGYVLRDLREERNIRKTAPM